MKKLLYIFIAAMVSCLVACEKQTPFDTQSPDDAPLILKPYNESGTGSFTYDLANPDTPLFDSVTVTPSAYTTVNWYLDKERVFTGTKIEMTFPAGTYDLTIEAVTEAGKRTQRTGTVIVHPYAQDPFAAAPSRGRQCVPEYAVFFDGQNLTKVAKVLITRDVAGNDVAATIDASTTDDALLSIFLPALANGHYFFRFVDAAGVTYGADAIDVYNEAIALDGYADFSPNSSWTITGMNLQNVASVSLAGETISDIVVTSTSVTFMAPDKPEGKYTLSMKNADGSAVLFVDKKGAVEETITQVSSEVLLWSGEVTIDWNADLINITKEQMEGVPVGASIIIYFTIPDAEYHAMRITTPWWGDDLVAQMDGFENTPSPFSFVYDDRCKGIVDMVGSWSIVGFGVTVNKITYK